SVQRVDLRTQVLDIHPQDVITKEQIRLKVDAVVYYKVTDAYKSVVEVKDYREALTQLLHSQIRNSISKLSVEDVIAGTDSIAKELHGVLANAEEQWGVAIKKVEIQSVELPKGLADAMQKRRAASDYKRKLETEAEARKIGIETVNEAASKISDRTLAYLYLDTLKRIGDGKATKIIFPLELTHIAELFAKNRVESNDYARIAEQLSRAYRERQKEELDGETDEKESPQAPVGHRKAPLKKLKGRAG
ncbi:MAG: paraslipin, partial [Candidatus Micrarchaeia archaeon]